MLTLKQPDEFSGGPEHARAVAHAAFDVVNALGPGGGKGFVLLNDLRLEGRDGVAWIDHLLLHRYGFVLIESRTCAQRTQCDGGLWFRQDRGAWCEVLSPIPLETFHLFCQAVEISENYLKGKHAVDVPS